VKPADALVIVTRRSTPGHERSPLTLLGRSLEPLSCLNQVLGHAESAIIDGSALVENVVIEVAPSNETELRSAAEALASALNEENIGAEGQN
jgi:hypothetical protein